MKTMIIATQNKHKIKELSSVLQPLGYDVKTLYDYPEIPPIEETGTTFEENALIKAKTLSDITNLDVIADDSGLVVSALGGAPGVYSARFAGDNATYQDNNERLLETMADKTDRQAYFITVICLYIRGEGPRYFTGTLHGEIARDYHGDNGFGYDPIFELPDGRHLAELSMSEKNKLSHRGQALIQLMQYLSNNQ